MPRQPRLDVPGTLHHVMIRGIERRNIFRNRKDRKDFLDRLSYLVPETQTACYAWSFMSNHAHFLFRSGPLGIADLMKRLLTGYVISFNRRYGRSGQLFYNRYKSIICDEEAYFRELVRYIHLNPIRAGIVSTIEELNVFPYSGHSVIMGACEKPWQHSDYVLKYFSSKDGDARKLYCEYVESGLHEKNRDDLSSGTVIKSLKGWVPLGETKETQVDQRILGDSDFVKTILSQSGEDYERRTLLKNKGYVPEKIAAIIAGMYGISTDDLLSKGRHAPRVEARSLYCYIMSRELGITVTQLAREIGMTPSAMTYAVERGKVIAQRKRFSLG